MKTLRVLKDNSATYSCPYCRANILDDDEVAQCYKCNTFHHLTCWQQNQRKCSVFECGGDVNVGDYQGLNEASSLYFTYLLLSLLPPVLVGLWVLSFNRYLTYLIDIYILFVIVWVILVQSVYKQKAKCPSCGYHYLSDAGLFLKKLPKACLNCKTQL